MAGRMTTGMPDPVQHLREEIAACRICAAQLGHEPRPVVRFSAVARIVIIGQAPGARVHASGVPWDDASGERLRAWTGLTTSQFYDPDQVALVPMGFCYPGKGASGDLPPRRECAPQWHERVLAMLPAARLTLLVGSHAQARYLPRAAGRTLTEAVQQWAAFGPGVIPLPHPAWRSTGWMAQHPWFAAEVLPALQAAVRARLD